MMKDTGRRLLIRLDEDSDWTKELQEKLGIKFPLYMHCYSEALNAILRSIDENCDLSQKEKRLKKTADSENPDFAAPLETSNIIAFIGDRGAGKTTAINEFSYLLGDYHNKRELWNQVIPSAYRREEASDCCFYLLSPIDASILGKKEDLMEVILASMYRVFRHKTEGCGHCSLKAEDSELYRRIIREFDEAYKAYITSTKHENKVNLGESVLVKLKDISGSLKTKKALDVLIRDFLKLLSGSHYCEEAYLVIVVDDLDMNPENGYEMLEQLHKYLENPNVFIVTAIKYKQMMQHSEKHFVDSLIPECGKTHADVFEKYTDFAKHLSNDYLLKVLPLSNRIYIPEGKQLYKRGRVSYINNPGNELPVKEFILRKIAARMNIFYDGKGLKKHFCMPNTVRELVSYNAFLDSLFSMKEIIESADKKQMDLYDQNHERFNRDLENRMVLPLLRDDQEELYSAIAARDIERRAEYAVSFVKGWSDYKKSGGSGRFCLKDTVDGLGYHYMDLLETLYNLGREDYTDKPLVHCILASFTSEMVREYYSYLHNKNEEARMRSAARLKSFLGNGFSGTWLGNIVGADSEGKEPAEETKAPEGETEGSEGTIKVSGERILYIEDIPLSNLEFVLKTWTKEEWENEKGDVVNAVIEYIPYVECFSLLFSNLRDDNGAVTFPKWKFKLEVGAKDTGELKFIAENEVMHADFDALGFIGKELMVKTQDELSYGEGLHKELSDALICCIKDYCSNNGVGSSKKRNLPEKVKKKSIFKGEETKAVFPYYSLDMSYNIIKRVRKSIIMNKGLKQKDIFSYFKTIYGYVAEELKKEEDYYQEISGTARDEVTVPELYNDFISSPFIQAFGIEVKNEATVKGVLKPDWMNEIFKQFVRGIPKLAIDKGMADMDASE